MILKKKIRLKFLSEWFICIQTICSGSHLWKCRRISIKDRTPCRCFRCRHREIFLGNCSEHIASTPLLPSLRCALVLIPPPRVSLSLRQIDTARAGVLPFHWYFPIPSWVRVSLSASVPQRTHFVAHRARQGTVYFLPCCCLRHADIANCRKLLQTVTNCCWEKAGAVSIYNNLPLSKVMWLYALWVRKEYLLLSDRVSSLVPRVSMFTHILIQVGKRGNNIHCIVRAVIITKIFFNLWSDLTRKKWNFKHFGSQVGRVACKVLSRT